MTKRRKYIFFLDARGALKGRLEKKELQLEQSGILQFEYELKTFLATKRGRTKLLRFSTLLEASIKEARQLLNSRRESILNEFTERQRRQQQNELNSPQMNTQQVASDFIQTSEHHKDKAVGEITLRDLTVLSNELDLIESDLNDII